MKVANLAKESHSFKEFFYPLTELINFEDRGWNLLENLATLKDD